MSYIPGEQWLFVDTGERQEGLWPPPNKQHSVQFKSDLPVVSDDKQYWKTSM